MRQAVRRSGSRAEEKRKAAAEAEGSCSGGGDGKILSGDEGFESSPEGPERPAKYVELT